MSRNSAASRPSGTITGDPRDRRRGAGWEYVHVCIDDASRLAYSEVLPDERKDSAVGFLKRTLGWFAGHGVTVERVMTDNGSAYRSEAFRAAVATAGLKHKRTRPYTPRTNSLPLRRRGARPSGLSKPACASGPTPAPMPARRSAARR